MNFSYLVKIAATFQKLSHDDQLMLQIAAQEGTDRLGRGFLKEAHNSLLIIGSHSGKSQPQTSQKS